MLQIKLFVLFFVTVMLWFNVSAQSRINTFTRSNGLTSNTIVTTKMDSKGVVWIGTSNGVSAYVGDNWVEIKSISDNNGNSKNLGRVSIIHETGDGDIWIISNKGIFIYDGKFWTHFSDNENDGFVISEVFEDRRGWIWIFYEKYQSLKDVGNVGFLLVEGTLQVFDGRNWLKFPSDIGGTAAISIGEPNIYFTSHIQDNDGNFWVTNIDGTYFFNGDEWQDFKKDPLPTDICYDVLQANNKDIWVATKYGIAVYSDSTWSIYDKVKGIKGNTTESVYMDNSNRIWVTVTRDNRFRNLTCFNNGVWKSYSREKIGIKTDIEGIMDFGSNVLVWSKRDMSVFNGKSWENIFDINDIKEDRLCVVVQESRERLLIAGFNGLYELNNSGLSIITGVDGGWKPVCIYEDKSGRIWVGTERKGVFQISNNEVEVMDEENGMPSNTIKDIFEDRSGNIWFVTGWGIVKYDNNN